MTDKIEKEQAKVFARRSCKICVHPEVKAIEEMILRGVGPEAIKKRFGIAVTTYYVHKKGHMTGLDHQIEFVMRSEGGFSAERFKVCQERLDEVIDSMYDIFVDESRSSEERLAAGETFAVCVRERVTMLGELARIKRHKDSLSRPSLSNGNSLSESDLSDLGGL